MSKPMRKPTSPELWMLCNELENITQVVWIKRRKEVIEKLRRAADRMDALVKALVKVDEDTYNQKFGLSYDHEPEGE